MNASEKLHEENQTEAALCSGLGLSEKSANSRTQGPERDENFAPFHIKALHRGRWPISKKSEFKGGMICVNFRWLRSSRCLCSAQWLWPKIPLKIGYIDPLSGGGASVGEKGLKTFQFLADELNAKGGDRGKQVEIVPFDDKVNPQESLIQAQKAIDAGTLLPHPGQWIVGCRRADGFRHQVQRAQSR